MTDAPQPASVTVVEAGIDPARGTGRYTPAIVARGHDLLSDEPRDNGGDDQGPGPFDLVLAGLGSCTSMTVRMYADRKQWPLERIEVALSHRRETVDGEGITRIDRAVRLIGDLDVEQRERLLEIANRCPVHRALSGTIAIDTHEV